MSGIILPNATAMRKRPAKVFYSPSTRQVVFEDDGHAITVVLNFDFTYQRATHRAPVSVPQRVEELIRTTGVNDWQLRHILNYTDLKGGVA